MNNTLVTINNLQLQMGFIAPTLENTSLQTEYVAKSFLIGLYARLKELGTALWIK